MNDFELEARLKAVPLPARTEEYWEDFPGRVRSQLRPGFVEQTSGTFRRRLVWGGAAALACLILALTFSPAFEVMLRDARTIRREWAQLPAHLRVLMADEHGMHYLIADRQPAKPDHWPAKAR